MSNEIQLALSQGHDRGLSSQGSQWGGPLGAADAGQASALKSMHRMLRGRYIIAGILAGMFAVVFAAAGFMVSKPAYKSDATLEIDPSIPTLNDPIEKVMAMQNLYIQSRMALLKDERVAQLAMTDPRWKELPFQKPVTLEKFKTSLTVEQPPKSPNFITVTYTDNSKQAQKIVQVAVACTIKAFKDTYGQDDNKGIEDKLGALNYEEKGLNDKVESLRQNIDIWGKDGADDPQVIRAHDDEAIRTQASINDALESLKQAQDDKKQAEQSAGGRKFSIEDFARVDVTMAGQVKAMYEDQLRLDALKSQLGMNNPAVISARQVVDARQARMQTYADYLNSLYVIRWRPDVAGGALIFKDLSTLEASIQRMQALYDRESKLVADMRGRLKKIQQATNLIQQANERVAEINTELRNLNYVHEHAVHTRYLDEMGTEPALDKDRRPIVAAIGFMGGAGLPIGVMLLIGMFDSRYRFSDETNSAMRGLTLLGILPNLPDRLSDPEQAGIAAHCVHQIRTMLQINGAPDERRVFAITSASPGDGKTSLTLALGLSYAACGTSTLLIDCDLIGAGLTARMNVSAAEGVLEAIANRSLLPYVRTTDIADVAILPVGSAGTMHASTLSPAALRRLVEEAEKHFETVLIDTGPILGSIEASLVCAAADAVVLAVARGQQRPIVEKSLSHLTAIGARLAGVVFNRAQAQDFERSISGVSMRSVGIPGQSRSRAEQVSRFAAIPRPVTSDVPVVDDTGENAEGDEQD